MDQVVIQINYWVSLLLIFLPWVYLVIGLALVISLCIVAALKAWDISRLLGQKVLLLELTPPAFTDKVPLATQQLFSVLHGLGATRPLLDRLLRRKVVFSLELVSSREQGIRYILRAAESEVPTIRRNINSYLPDVRVNEVGDYLSANDGAGKAKIIDFRQTGHFAFPLQIQESLEDHDPIAYLAGLMTKLAPGEQIAFQMVVSPVKVREAASIAHGILGNEDMLMRLSQRRLRLIQPLLNGANSILFGAIDLVGDIFHGPSKTIPNSAGRIADHQLQVAMRLKPARTLSVFEQHLAESIQHKVSQPLYRVAVRALVDVDAKQDESERLKGIRASLDSYTVPGYQSLRAGYGFSTQLQEKYQMFAFKHRLTSFFKKPVLLAASEVAGIYHFPNTNAVKTENVVKSLSKTLPAPLSLKDGTELDLVLGRNNHHGTLTSIGLTLKERERHIYIIGGTGNGKTTMMLYAMIQDASKGKGFAFIDPHGDASETILKHVPRERINDVIYFNPDDLSHPIGLNLLELPEGISGDELLREKDLVTESTISVFRKIFSEEGTGGHRIEYVLRNAIQTALTQPGATLFTIFSLLNDPKYRKEVVGKLEDKDLKNFWQNEMGKAGEFQRVKMAAGITAKIGRFLFSASAKRILEQPKSTIDFDEILNSGKILICNFSKGLLGEDTSELFGITVLAKLQMAALRRARMEQSDRRAFYLYVDEFQNFATTSFVQLLSEARKYKLFLTMAEQSTSQQTDQQMVNIILANVGTVICFRSGNPADERLLLPLFSPYIEPGEISNLPSFNFYARLSAIKPQEPLSGETLLLVDKGSAEISKIVVQRSRINYAVKAAEVSRPAKEIEPAPKKPTARHRRKAPERIAAGPPSKQL